MRIRTIAPFLSGLFILAACGGGSSGNGPGGGDAGGGDASGDGAGGGATVMVGPNGSLTFQPATLTVKVGETVTWVWAGSGHSVVSGTGCMADSKFCSPNDTSCASTSTSASGAMYTHKFTQAGTFPYFCLPHCSAGMTGTITVQ